MKRPEDMTDEEMDQYLGLHSMTDEQLDAKLASLQQPENKKSGTADAILRGLSRGVSLEFGDEMSGAAGALAGYFGLAPNKGYDYYRDFARSQDKAAQNEYPGTTLGSQVVGGAATQVIPGFQLSKGIVPTLRSGAILGAGAGVGASEKDLGSSGMVEDMTTGGVAGLAGSALGLGLSKAAQSAPNILAKYFGQKAEGLAERAVGAERGTIKSKGDKKIQEAVRYALDEGVISPFATTKKMQTRNTTAQDMYGKQMENVYNEIDKAGASKFNPLQVATKVDENLGGFLRTPLNKGRTKALENTLESILWRGENNLPLKDAQLLKEELGTAANWINKLNPSKKEVMARKAYGIVAQEIDNAAMAGADVVGSPELVKSLRGALKAYSGSKTLEDLLNNKAARERGGKMIGLTDYIAGGAGLAGAYPTNGISMLPFAILGIKKFGEGFGPQMGARAYDNLAKGLGVSSKFLKKIEPQINMGIQSGARGLYLNQEEENK